MITVAEASERILAAFEPLSAEPVPTARAEGRVLAEPVFALRTSPPWDNSSMDGYAVRSADLAAPGTLTVVETIAAGFFPSRSLGAGEAARIMTGAPVPHGADSVIRREDTDDGTTQVTILDLRDAGRNIRRRGEDFEEGDLVADRGTRLGIPHLALLASAGIQSLHVHRKPRVAIISSGDELVRLEDYTSDLKDTKVISANSVSLAAAVRAAGAEPVDLGIADDTRESISALFAQGSDADLILTTAGISVGDHDFVRAAVSSLGGTMDFWRVRMRPGAPLASGTVCGTRWLGLSGNPVSAIVTFELFVRPVIHRLLGHRAVFPATMPVRLAENVSLAANLMHFLRVVVETTTEGPALASLAGSQSSAVISTLARANALLILPGDRLEVKAGETHRALPLGGDWDSSEKLELA